MAKDPSRSRGRRWLFGGAAAALAIVTIELLSLGVFRAVAGQGFAYAQLDAMRAQRRDAAAAEGIRQLEVPPYVANKAIHPYLGYVADLRDASGQRLLGVSEFGYLDGGVPIRERSPDRVVVGVVGGSVAMGFTSSPAAQATFAQRLGETAEFRGRRVDLVRLALPGYRQPQQLMTLSYLIALGGEFDLVINIDGFNEVALHPAENARFGVHYAFPRLWYLHVLGGTLPGTDAYRALEAQRRETAARFSRPLLRASVTANTAWWLLDRRLGVEVAKAREALLEQRPASVPYAATGPPDRAEGAAEMEKLVALWKRSSLQIDQLARANGARYYHFLQPNQYVEGSKPLSPEELRRAFSPRHAYRPGAVRGYPLLRRAGAELAAAGVRFHDLTQVFADHPETLYIDPCCHFGEAGFALFADALADAVFDDLEASPATR